MLLQIKIVTVTPHHPGHLIAIQRHGNHQRLRVIVILHLHVLLQRLHVAATLLLRDLRQHHHQVAILLPHALHHQGVVALHHQAEDISISC